MKITFLVNHDISALLALNYLLPNLQSYDTQILFTKKFANASDTPKALTCLKKFDAKLVAQSTGLSSFDELGAVQANEINHRDFSVLEMQQPDLVVSIRHMTILQQATIDLPRLGVLNLHSGVLPNYQGVMASFWAMLQAEKQLGTSLHWIEDSKIDTGSIVARSSVKTDYDKSYLWNVLNLYRGGCAEITSAIESLAATGTVESAPQMGQPQYFSFPTQVDIDGAEFKLFSSSDTVESFIINPLDSKDSR